MYTVSLLCVPAVFVVYCNGNYWCRDFPWKGSRCITSLLCSKFAAQRNSVQSNRDTITTCLLELNCQTKILYKLLHHCAEAYQWHVRHHVHNRLERLHVSQRSSRFRSVSQQNWHSCEFQLWTTSTKPSQKSFVNRRKSLFLHWSAFEDCDISSSSRILSVAGQIWMIFQNDRQQWYSARGSSH